MLQNRETFCELPALWSKATFSTTWRRKRTMAELQENAIWPHAMQYVIDKCQKMHTWIWNSVWERERTALHELRFDTRSSFYSKRHTTCFCSTFTSVDDVFPTRMFGTTSAAPSCTSGCGRLSLAFETRSSKRLQSSEEERSHNCNGWRYETAHANALHYIKSHPHVYNAAPHKTYSEFAFGAYRVDFRIRTEASRLEWKCANHCEVPTIECDSSSDRTQTSRK